MDHRTLQAWLKNEDLCPKMGDMLPKPHTELKGSTDTLIYLDPDAKKGSLITVTRVPEATNIADIHATQAM